MKALTLFLCSFPILATHGAELPGKERPSPKHVESRPSIGVLTIAEVTRTALANNASIKATRAKWEMMRARVPQAAAWEDPMIGADVERYGTTQFGTYTDIEYMVSQRIPFAGKNRSRARAADAEALATLEELRRQQLDVIMKARSGYFRLANAFAQLDVNRRNESLLEQFVEISRTKYQVGGQNQADVLLAETDLIRLQEQQRDLERTVSDAQSQLNVLMNRPARSPLGQPADLTIHQTVLSASRLEALALANRPELLMAERKINAEEQKLEVAKRDWIPEPEVRIEARQYRGMSSRGITEYDTGIFFNVPWGNWKKYAAQENEARRSIDMATQEREAARIQALGLVRDQLRKIETFHHHVELFQDRLLPTARLTVETSRTGYESNKATFLELITAQRGLRDIEATYYMHLAEYHMALAELEAIVGSDLQIFPAPTVTVARDSK
jgi:outer membrane protein TolC